MTCKEPVEIGNSSLLVVDDCAIMRQSLKQILCRAGFQSLTLCADGEQAWRLLAEGRETKQPCFDLILSDIEMPRMDGLRLTDKIKEDAFLRRTPVVLFSSRCDAKGEANKRLSPADAEVRKFEYKKLIAAITMCLHQ